MKLKKLSIICLSFFLSSCGNLKFEGERCLVDLKNDSCYCHQYHINKDFIGVVGETYEKDFEYCNKLVGFTPNEWGKLILFLNKVQRKLRRK
jgi:hypothetical protein